MVLRFITASLQLTQLHACAAHVSILKGATLSDNARLKMYGTAAIGGAAVFGVIVGALAARASAAARIRQLTQSLAQQVAATGENLM